MYIFTESGGLYLFYITGESSVGKSSLVMRFVKDQFRENQDSTIGGTVTRFLFLKFLDTFALLYICDMLTG